MSEAVTAVNPNLVLAIGISLVMIMVLGTAVFAAVAVLRPKMRMKRRMAEMGLVGTGGARVVAERPHQKRIQENPDDLEDKSKDKPVGRR